MSPIAITSGCPGTVRSVSTTMRPPLVSSTPSISASGLARTPAAHTTTPAGSTVPSARWTMAKRPVGGDAGNPDAGHTSTPRRIRVRRARSLDLSDIAPSSRGAASTRMTLAARTSTRREVLGEHPGEQLHHRPGGLDARRTAAAEHDVELAALGSWPGRSTPARSGPTRRGGDRGRRQDPSAGSCARPHRRCRTTSRRRRRRSPACRTGVSSPAPSPRSSVHDPGVEVDAGDRRHVHRDVVLAAEHATDCVGDVVGVEPRRGDLVEQRLEQVEVVGVDDLHIDGRSARALATASPPNPGADHHNPRTRALELTHNIHGRDGN